MDDLLPFNHKEYNFREKKNCQVMKEREYLNKRTDKRGVNVHCFYGDWTKVVICWFKLQLWIWLADWTSANKLFNGNLVGDLEENRSSFRPITIEEIVIFMINTKILHCAAFCNESCRLKIYICFFQAQQTAPIQ